MSKIKSERNEQLSSNQNYQRTLSEDLIRRLHNFMKLTNQTKAEIIAKALEEYLEKHKTIINPAIRKCLERGNPNE